MTIALPYRYDVRNGLELMFALRSIEQYLSGWDDVVIVGEPPTWYKGRSISVQDYSGRKEFSTYNKLLKFCERYNVENFLYWNDDHFLLQPLDVKDIKYWHDGPLNAEQSGSARNRQAKMNTMELMKNLYAPVEILNYDIHTPIIFNKKYFSDIFNGHQEELIIKTFYCSLATSWNQQEPMSDCKIEGEFDEEQIKAIIANRLFFSTGSAIAYPTINVLKELFPNKSKFEI